MRRTSAINYTQPVNWNSPINRGLTAWWKVLPRWNGGLIWRDLCNKNHGILTNMDPVTDWVVGSHLGGYSALDFDGTNDRIVTTAATTTAGITVAAWIYPRSFGGSSRGRILSGGNPEVNIFYVDNVNVTSGFTFSQLAGGFGFPTTTNTIILNTWQHVAATVESGGTTATMYLNGKNAGVVTGIILSAVNAWAIGGRVSADDRNFDGMIDDVMIFDGRSLNDNEIFSLYNDSILANPQRLNRISFRSGRQVISIPSEVFQRQFKLINNNSALIGPSSQLIG